MTSLRQIEANRRNALKSTGPVTAAGKQRSRRNALRHGLTAETVIGALEDPLDYRAFERSITAGFDVQTAVERELVLRLASLLWRLRRATAIETGLLEIANRPDESSDEDHNPKEGYLNAHANSLRPGDIQSPQVQQSEQHLSREIRNGEAIRDKILARTLVEPNTSNGRIARRFLNVAIFDSAVFDRLSRYEYVLWRQVRQILFTLDALRRPNLSRKPWWQHAQENPGRISLRT
jgi:hypothetical protein